MSRDLLEQLHHYGWHFETVLHSLEREEAAMQVLEQDRQPETRQRLRPAVIAAVAAFVVTVITIGGITLLAAGNGDELTVAAPLPSGTVLVYGPEAGIPDGCAWSFVSEAGRTLVGGPCGLLELTNDSWTKLTDPMDGNGPVDLEIAPDGTVWMANVDTGVGSYDGDTLTAHDVHAPYIEITPDGTVWARLFEQRLMSYDGTTWSDEPGDGQFGELAVAPHGTLWAMVDREPPSVDSSPGWYGAYMRLTSDGWVDVELPAEVGPGGLYSIPQGIVIGSALFDGREWTLDFVPPAPGLSDLGIEPIQFDDGDSIDTLEALEGVVVTPNGDIWLGSMVFGAFRYSDGEWTHYGTGNGLASERLTFIEMGPDGSIWMGSQDAGLTRLMP